jgi:L-ribulose-5-phosphate 3-epimerase UlaE
MTPHDDDPLTLAWLRLQFGRMKQFDNIRIPLDEDRERCLLLEWHDETATGPVYKMRANDDHFFNVRISTVGQVRGLLKLYSLPEKQA